jgi:serine/threonine protein kinase
MHRDLKPGNIIVSHEGDVKILDFGIAKATSNLYQTTVADMVRGTPIYMSPEQANGEPLDRRSDLFALGGVSWRSSSPATGRTGSTQQPR